MKLNYKYSVYWLLVNSSVSYTLLWFFDFIFETSIRLFELGLHCYMLCMNIIMVLRCFQIICGLMKTSANHCIIYIPKTVIDMPMIYFRLVRSNMNLSRIWSSLVRASSLCLLIVFWVILIAFMYYHMKYLWKRSRRNFITTG